MRGFILVPALLLLPHSLLPLFSFLSLSFLLPPILTFQIQLLGPFPLSLSSGFLIPVPDFSYVLLSATEQENHDHRGQLGFSPTSRREPLRATNQTSSSGGETVGGREVEYGRNIDKSELDFRDRVEKKLQDSELQTLQLLEEEGKGTEDTTELEGYPKERGNPITTLYFLLLLYFGRGGGLQMCSPSPLQRTPCTL